MKNTPTTLVCNIFLKYSFCFKYFDFRFSWLRIDLFYNVAKIRTSIKKYFCSCFNKECKFHTINLTEGPRSAFFNIWILSCFYVCIIVLRRKKFCEPKQYYFGTEASEIIIMIKRKYLQEYGFSMTIYNSIYKHVTFQNYCLNNFVLGSDKTCILDTGPPFWCLDFFV